VSTSAERRAGGGAVRRAPGDEDLRRLAGLAGLPAGERAVLELVTDHGLGVPEAAAALGIRRTEARRRLRRARAARRALAVTARAHREVAALPIPLTYSGRRA
jgi:RNA polymerase sigma-70 factor (ECF subfamily)